MLVYIEFDDESYGYYECNDVYIDSKNINNSELYFGHGGSFPFRIIKRITLCKDGGVPTRVLFERRDGNENDFNR